MKLGRLNHIGIATRSIANSIAYYRDVMGATHIYRTVRLARSRGEGLLHRYADNVRHEWHAD